MIPLKDTRQLGFEGILWLVTCHPETENTLLLYWGGRLPLTCRVYSTAHLQRTMLWTWILKFLELARIILNYGGFQSFCKWTLLIDPLAHQKSVLLSTLSCLRRCPWWSRHTGQSLASQDSVHNERENEPSCNQALRPLMVVILDCRCDCI